MALANTRDIEQYTDSLARYMPGGDLFASRNVADSTFRKLLRGLSGELFRCNGLIKEYCEQIIPDTTTKFVSEWESALGIPDDCFAGTGTLEERRLHVLIKLSSLGVQTQQDFIDLALFFGVTATVTNGTLHGTFPMEFPITFFNSSQDARFTIIINFDDFSGDVFPYTFPILFGNAAHAIIQCLFEKLKPANTELLFSSTAAEFSPSDLDNLVLWLDAADETTIIESGGAVSQWNDKSGNGNNATQGVASLKPTFISNGINGKGAIAFVGAISPFMFLDSLISETDLTAMAVFVNTEATGSGMILSDSIVNNQLLRIDPDESSNGTLFSFDGNTQAEFDFASSITDTPLFLRTEFEASTAQRIYLDGVLKDSVSYNGTIQTDQLGRLFSIVQQMGGRIGELLVYARILSPSEIQLIHNYISSEWSITLPAEFSPFSPSDLDNLVLWLDAADETTITSSGDAVSEWADKSGTSINAVQTTGANRPITGARMINGLNVLDFDAGVHFMALTSQPIIGTQARTMVCVGFADDGGSENHCFNLSNNFDGNGGVYIMTYEVGVRIGGANRLFTSDAVESGIAAIITMTNQTNSTLENNASNFQAYKNGALLSGGTSFSETTTVDTNSTGGAIATVSVDNAGSLDGVLGEIIMYDRVLNSSELDILNVYLSDKWGIALS